MQGLQAWHRWQGIVQLAIICVAARADCTGAIGQFQAIINNPSGVVYAERNYAESWQAIKRPENRIELYIAELVGEIEKLAHTKPEVNDPNYPFVLSAGERRNDTANTAG